MMARLKQVLVMHFAWYCDWRLVGITLLVVLLVWGLLARSFDADAPIALVAAAMPGLLIGSYLMMNAKGQFATYQARLLPRFAGSHLFVLACGVILTSLAFPAVVAAWFGASLMGMLAYALLAVTTMTWAYAANPTTFYRSLISTAAIMSGGTTSTARFWFAPIDDYEPLRAVILLVAVAWIGCWLYRLPRSIEKNDGYTRRVLARPGASEHLEALQSRRFEAWRLAWLRNWSIDLWHDRLQSARATTIRQRQRLLSYGDSPLAVLPSFLGILLAMLVFVAVLAMVGGTDSLQDFLSIGAGGVTLIATFGVPLLPLAILSTRRPRMGQELLFPWTRREYINGLFKRLIFSAVIVEMACGALLLLLWGLSRHLVEGVGIPKSSTIQMTAVGIVLFQLYLFGCSLHIARATSGMVRLCLTIVSVLVLFAGVYFFGALFGAVGPLVGRAMLVAVGVGGLLWIRKARDEWLLEELG